MIVEVEVEEQKNKLEKDATMLEVQVAILE